MCMRKKTLKTTKQTFYLFIWDPRGCEIPMILFGWWPPGMASWRICYWPRHSWKCASWCGGPVSPLPHASRCGWLLCMGFAAFWLEDTTFFATYFLFWHNGNLPSGHIYVVYFCWTWKASPHLEFPFACWATNSVLSLIAVDWTPFTQVVPHKTTSDLLDGSENPAITKKQSSGCINNPCK